MTLVLTVSRNAWGYAMAWLAPPQPRIEKRHRLRSPRFQAGVVAPLWFRRLSRLTSQWGLIVSVVNLLWVVGMVVFVLGSAGPGLGLAIAQLCARRWMSG